MVVFTCNNCGESLQKPKVEKHYATVCRTSKNLTCVDCLKDFKEEAYAVHTKCITEKERYSAKGTVNVVGKGEAKQRQWVDMITEIVQINRNVTGPQKVVFEMISNYIEQVPRKKMKFLNFIKNHCGNQVTYADIEAVWDIIEKHKSDSANDAEPNLQAVQPQSKTDENLNVPKKKKRKMKNGESADQDEDSVSNKEEIKTTLEVAENAPKKKKKKSKDGNSEVEVSTEIATTNGKKRKSKKSESNDQENKGEVCETTALPQSKKRKSNEFQLIEFVKAGETPKNQTSDDVTGVELNSQKKKKRKSKGSEETVEVNKDDAAKDTTAIELNSQQKKKRKSKDAQENVVNGSGDQTDELSVKSKSPKNKSEGNAIAGSLNDSQKKNGNEQDNKITDENDSNVNKSLENSILNVLQNKDNVSLLKLQKNVLKQQGGVDTPKFRKSFEKKLDRLVKKKTVEVLDNNVKLINVD